MADATANWGKTVLSGFQSWEEVYISAHSKQEGLSSKKGVVVKLSLPSYLSRLSLPYGIINI
jgi:hypothetical protein